VITLYHRTQSESAETILHEGFKAGIGTYITVNERTGVWLSNVPLNIVDLSPSGPTLLRVTLSLAEADIERFELVEDGKPYREWLIPAEVINANSTIEMLDEAAEEAILEEIRTKMYSPEVRAEIRARAEEIGRRIMWESGGAVKMNEIIKVAAARLMI
jgi:hypothetical protein